MKQILLLFIVLGLGLATYSQHETKVVNHSRAYEAVPYDAVNTAIGDVSDFNNPVSPIRGNVNLGPTEAQIGMSYYDLFSNYNTGNRFTRFDDGTMTGVFIYGEEATAFPGRGTGYNYYDGTAWGPIPTGRIESVRTGWPAYDAWGENGEIFVSHDFALEELVILKRENKGNAMWSEMTFPHPGGPENLVWPRLVTSGDNNEYIHLIGCTNAEWMGQNPTYVYSRSSDGGQSWDPHNIVIDGMGEDYYLSVVQDRCVMASKGNSVAILYVDLWADLYYVRSDDNGETWEKTVIWEHPEPFFDPATFDPATQSIDTFFAPDYSGHLTFDEQGHIHVVFGLTRGIATEETGAAFYPYNPEWEGIVYWNDMMEPFSNELNALAPPPYNPDETELVIDETYIGWLQDVDGNGVIELEQPLPIRTYGISTQPSITVDEFGRRFVIWAANTEGFVYSGGDVPTNYKHIWARAYANTVWGEYIDLTEDISHIFDDCVYPMIASTSDENIHYIYQTDIAPGNAIDGDHDYHENYWVYGMLPKSDVLTGIAETDVIDNDQVSQNFPNPFSTTSNVSVTLEQEAQLSLFVTNLTGQKVLEIDKGRAVKGIHTFTIDGSLLGSGIYFYTVQAGESAVTRKMIIK